MANKTEIVEINMITAEGIEEKKKFTLKPYPDKFEWYREQQKFMANTTDPFVSLLGLITATFEKCVEGIEIDGLSSDIKYIEKVKEFFTNDPQALDVLAGMVVNFQTPSIKRN